MDGAPEPYYLFRLCRNVLAGEDSILICDILDNKVQDVGKESKAAVREAVLVAAEKINSVLLYVVI